MKRLLNLFCVTHVIQESCQTRCVLVSLVMALLLSVNAFATETVRTTITIDGEEYYLYTGFNAIEGTGYNEAHNYEVLVDGDMESWYLDEGGYVEFSSILPIALKGYVFDSMDPEANPSSWTLKAKANEEDDWNVVSSRSDDISSGTNFSFACDNQENKAYRYFRFEMEGEYVALSEIRLYGGKEFYFFLPQKSATCTETGIKQACYLGGDGKYFADETGTNELLAEDVIAPIVPHTLEDETAHVSTCTVCGQTIITDPHIFLDENGETRDCICGAINPDHNHGYCGDPEVNDGKDVTWRVTQEEDGNYTLTISGTGRMANFQSNWDEPWNKAGNRDYLDKITKAVISDGVTYVGRDAFFICPGLKTVEIPSSVTAIGNAAFGDCDALAKVEMPCSLDYSSRWWGNESAFVKYHVYEGQPFVDGEDGTHHQKCKCGNTTSTPESHAFTVEDVTIDGANVSGATCTEKAKYYKSCVCGALSTSEVFEYGEALGHAWGEYHLDGDQTCTYDGHKTAECTREGCSEENKIVATGAALGHAWGEYALDGDQTCTEDGHKTAHCTRTGCTETDKIEATGAALGHDYTSETTTAPYLKNKATCIADAVYYHKCSHCESKGATTWTKEGSALGHSWGEYHLDGDQTCTYDGHKTAECTREGCSEENKIGATGAALGHDWEDYFTTDIAATCTEAGSESRHCARCSATTDVAPIVAHGHSFTDYISNGDATTEADGTKTAVCDHGCGETDTVIDEGSRIVETPTGITNVESGHSHKAIKTIENGRVVIIRDGVKYDLAGRKL